MLKTKRYAVIPYLSIKSKLPKIKSECILLRAYIFLGLRNSIFTRYVVTLLVVDNINSV
jgi:hypothetical protein